MNRPKNPSDGSGGTEPVQLLRDQVRRHPRPPRPVPFGPLLKRVLTRRDSLILMGLGAAALLFVVGWIGWTDPVGPASWVVAALFLVLGVVMLAAPVVFFRRSSHALRHGLVREATVHELWFHPPGETDVTPAARHNGFAWGMRVVDHPRGHFEDEFECDAAWAGDLEEGSTVRVLVHPTRKKTLLSLGPREAT